MGQCIFTSRPRRKALDDCWRLACRHLTISLRTSWQDAHAAKGKALKQGGAFTRPTLASVLRILFCMGQQLVTLGNALQFRLPSPQAFRAGGRTHHLFLRQLPRIPILPCRQERGGSGSLANTVCELRRRCEISPDRQMSRSQVAEIG